MKRPIFKKNIEEIQPYEPGKPIEDVERELGIKNIIKLASNENPLGPPESVVNDLKNFLEKVHLYPDGGTWHLREKLSEKLGIEKEEILVGNGSNEIIEFIVEGFVNPGDEVLSSEKTFLVYPLVTQAIGGLYKTAPLTKDWKYDLKALAGLVSAKTKVIFVANPNNPTGTYVNKRELESFLDSVPNDVIVCLDEAYFDFAEAEDYPNGIDYIKRGNVIILRTFSKSYGLAGLRIGYGVADKEIIGYLKKISQPFNANAMAQRAATVALDDEEYLKKSKEIVSEGKKYLYGQLKRLGLEYIPSETNFILFNVGRSAQDVFGKLLKSGVIVRAMTAYELPEYIRVSVGLEEENKKFINELEKILK